MIPVYFCLISFLKKLLLHIFLIKIAIRYSGMFHVPGFIDGQKDVSPTSVLRGGSEREGSGNKRACN